MVDKTVSLPSGRKVKVRQRVKRVKRGLPTVTLPPIRSEPNITIQSDSTSGEVLKQIQRDGIEAIVAMRGLEKLSAETIDILKQIRDSKEQEDVALSVEVTDRDDNGNIKSVTISGRS